MHDNSFLAFARACRCGGIPGKDFSVYQGMLLDQSYVPIGKPTNYIDRMFGVSFFWELQRRAKYRYESRCFRPQDYAGYCMYIAQALTARYPELEYESWKEQWMHNTCDCYPSVRKNFLSIETANDVIKQIWRNDNIRRYAILDMLRAAGCPKGVVADDDAEDLIIYTNETDIGTRFLGQLLPPSKDLSIPDLLPRWGKA